MGIRGHNVNYNFNKRNVVFGSLVVLTLIFSVSSILLQPSFQQTPGDVRVPVPLSGAGKYYNDWVTYPTTGLNKVTVVSDPPSGTPNNSNGVNRVSNAKFQDFRLTGVTIPPSAQNIRVLVEVTAKTISGTSGLNIMSITGTKNADWNFGSTITFSSSNFETKSRIFATNPVRGNNWVPGDFSNWITNGKEIVFALNHQTQQNSDKIQVGNFKVTILYTDITPPVTTITGATSGGVAVPNANGYYSKGTDITINFLATDVGSGVAYSECKLDTGSYSPCTSPKSYYGLVDGPHTVSIRSTDNAGNVESTATINWQQDTQLPVVTTSGAVTEQADQITGKLITYTASATDASPSSGLIGTAPNCSPIASGQVFPIADTTVTCTQADRSGNVGTASFLVRILPYLDLGYVEEGGQSTITVSDPAASGTIQVQTTCDTSGTTNVALTATSPGVFSAPIYTTLAPTGILNGIQNLQCAGSDGIDVAYTISRGTSTDSGVVQAAGSGANLGRIRALQFDSDVVHLGNNIGMSAQRTFGPPGTICNNNAAIETFTVQVTSPSDPPPGGITVTLTETAFNSCLFKTTENVWFIPGASTTSPLAIRTGVGQTVTATLNSVSPIETTTVGILPTAPSIPALGTVVTVTSATCASDTDQDGICNSPAWEGAGTPLTITGFGVTYTYTAAGGGCPRLLDDRNPTADYPVGNNPADLSTYNPITCPSSTSKDIFYEIDYMPNHKPSYPALLNVINVFRNAPTTGCPTGTTCPGPTYLHIKLDEVLPIHDPLIPWSGSLTTDNPMGGFDEIKRQFFMSSNERSPTVSAAIAAANLKSERQVMRYMLIAHQQEELSQRFSSGYSEIKGNDAGIYLGAFSLGFGNQMELESTILHEIGHNINLNHGGSAANAQNCKSNHLSNMNYLFQFTNFVSGRPLDFSRVELNALNENNLIDADGIIATGLPSAGTPAWSGTPPSSYTTAYGPPTYPSGILTLNLVPLSTTVTTPINWDGGASPTAIRTINDIDFPLCNDDIPPPPAVPIIYDNLVGSHDWSKIDLKFRANALFFGDGIQALNPINPTTGDFGGYENSFVNTGNGINPPVAAVSKIFNGNPAEVLSFTNPPLTFSTSVNEGDTFTLDLSGSTDLPSGSPELYGWNFGDLTQWDTPGEDVLGPSAIIFADDDDDETGDNIDDPDSSRFQIVDADANRVIGDVLVTVNNVVPTVSSPATLTGITEGDTLDIDAAQFTFTDPGIVDTHTASINWGDGSTAGSVSETPGTAPDLNAGTPRVDTSGTVDGSHLYPQDGTFSVLLTVTDKDGGSGSSTSSLTVLNDPPVITAISSSAGTFTDRGLNDPHTATITWGSGGPTSTILIPISDRTFTIPSPPADAACGTQTATVVVTDDDTSSASASFGFISSFCNGTFSSPLTNAQFKMDRTVPSNLSLKDQNGVPMASFVVTMFIFQNGVEQPVITSEGTNIAPFDSTSGTYMLHVKLQGYPTPLVIGQNNPVNILARVGTQTVNSGVFYIK